MEHLVMLLSKYVMIFVFLMYTFECFHVFRYTNNKEKQSSVYKKQRRKIFILHFLGFLVIFISTLNPFIIGFYLMQLVLFNGIFLIYKLFYKKASELLLNNMCMFLSISFIILTRISVEKAVKQFFILLVSACFSLLIPLTIRNVKFFRKFTWLYAAVGLVALLVILLAGRTSYGAKLSVSILGFSFQASEFVKISFVFFIASMLEKGVDRKKMIITTSIAALHVLVLIASKDLGSAFIFFMTYTMMIYVATENELYLLGGFVSTFLGLFVASQLFNHVKQRVVAWQNPLSVIDKEGYQICQSLFAIGTGGWFGLGLCQGRPDKIPVVVQDFIFAAISEELGGVFALCIIMVCISCLLMILNISIEMKDSFYQMVALGLGTTYAIQVFLTIGGVTKFIPSTGVTLPLLSYGGSSLLSTMIIFGIIQGLYIIHYDRYIDKNDKGGGTKKVLKPFDGGEVSGESKYTLEEYD
ncbi:FtsW/RodA/SpoVE family cell cycle protein [Lachnobacterium bovis]|uniref:Cell division protein FtsW, lipid II flippase n=1 Tax=Lachnobacterium bovis TaxID=140626 RepID=A0A1H9QND8_9FIRM|nr:FtsW/RodA/SpoVE family cell cycle protein [Lachnobacterium bovis]SER61930.1 cell division protein FtsW, lipid II flippase [Lachnobacterium bovis]